MSLAILKEQIKTGKIGNVYLFYGPEEFLKKYYLTTIERKLLEEELQDMNKVILDGKADIEKIVEACEALPVFSEHKLVVVKNSGLLKPKKDDGDVQVQKKSTKTDILTECLKNLPSYTCLIFYESEIDKRLKLTSTFKNQGLIVEFPYQSPIELVKWIKKGFKANGKLIDDEAASMLVEYCEPGMTDILNEINKLSVYKSESNIITIEDISKICSRSIKSRIFDLTDAVAHRDGGKALALLDEMVILREPIPRIFFMITKQLRLILEMKLMKENGISTDEASSRLSLTPYVAKKVNGQTRGFDTKKLMTALEECLYLDAAVKTGRMNDRIAAELLIAKLSKN